ncbi:nucleotide exchange factor GrpE [Actinomadura algeriensis]|uniref:Molecular chaperone GrpE (Heat shock protein) n=1 Tax=Actinomadura algeriensis TaxID=1679523 RepID=A0ABR9K3K9_9ACTN|nr:nucleotide exchange factor GrpE [Actinomadura algeriensis]MBE1537402.1 molecular chaperone GrpE (heat shock protein) [Actinomadura algeriensis]
MSSDGEDPPADGGDDAAFRAEVRDALAGLSARLDREHERAAHRESVIDRLHEENQRLRRGELQAMLEPVRVALYRVHDQARRLATADESGAASVLDALADDVADALARLGVERFRAEPGQPYDPSRHRPVAVAAVGPARDGTVVEARSDGFEEGGRVLRKAAVSVGRHEAETNGEPEPADETEEIVSSGSSRRGAAGRDETMNNSTRDR